LLQRETTCRGHCAGRSFFGTALLRGRYLGAGGQQPKRNLIMANNQNQGSQDQKHQNQPQPGQQSDQQQRQQGDKSQDQQSRNPQDQNRK